MRDFQFQPIGRVRSEINSREQAPKQGAETQSRAIIELDPAHRAAAADLVIGDWLWVLCWFHRSDPPRDRVHPRGDKSLPMRSLFTTRAPSRPNPISLNLVRLLAMEEGVLSVEGLEAFDDTPVLDLKPYVPKLDSPRQGA